MVHATKFLLRWLYLNNLIYDRAEIQSLPYLHPSQVEAHQLRQQQQQQQQQQIPYHDGGHPPPPHQPLLESQPSQQYQHQQQQQQQQILQNQSPNYPQPPQSQPPPTTKKNRLQKNDIEWRRKALCKIAMYPPGTSRLLALDSLRMEIVHQFAQELQLADDTIIQSLNCKEKDDDHMNKHGSGSSSSDSKSDSKSDSSTSIEKSMSESESNDQDNEVINLDDDASLLSKEQKNEEEKRDEQIVDEPTLNPVDQFPPSSSNKVSNADNGCSSINHRHLHYHEHNQIPYLDPKLKEALELQRETREYLPQFVSAILHSPPPLTSISQHHQQHYYYPTHHHHPTIDPIQTLRNLLLSRCVKDPNFGIELCWLLEAEVGRTWKSLFEHKQQSGKRLILVMPADKAMAIAKIGIEKQNAFDLLQDVECATAYGDYNFVAGGFDGNTAGGGTSDAGSYYDYHGEYSQQQQQQHQQQTMPQSGNNFDTTPPLPQSLSMKRCSHFGDTMHFIDRLTDISLKLRHVPLSRRHHVLQESLEDLNRRLRRRMLTEGNVSLDVDDNLGPYDWPCLNDIVSSMDLLKYSIHFPLEPTATIWPSGISSSSSATNTNHQNGGISPSLEKEIKDSSPLLALKTEHGVMRILNIVSPKSRLLASRERCPFLVHCEVVETGYEGSDARLYANENDDDVGVTLQEALGVVSSSSERQNLEHYSTDTGDETGSFSPYHIPSELSSIKSSNYDTNIHSQNTNTHQQTQLEQHLNTAMTSTTDDNTMMMLRGGEQEAGYPYTNINQNEYSSSSFSPYDVVQEEQLQQLHEHFQSNQHHPHYAPQESNYFPNTAQEGYV